MLSGYLEPEEKLVHVFDFWNGMDGRKTMMRTLLAQGEFCDRLMDFCGS